MGNGKKAVNGVPQRRETPEVEVEPVPEGPQDFVVVLAYTSDDGEVEENVGKLVEDLKALYTFKTDLRVYVAVEDAAKRILAKVEKPKHNPSNRGTLVISYELSDDVDESYARIARTADTVRDLFKDEPDVKVDVAVRESADEVLGVFGRSEG